MKALLISALALLLTGCSAKKPAPFMASTVTTPFSAEITENGDGLKVRFQSGKCVAGREVSEHQELIVPLGALAQCRQSIVDRLVDGATDAVMMFGTGFWIGRD